MKLRVLLIIPLLLLVVSGLAYAEQPEPVDQEAVPVVEVTETTPEASAEPDVSTEAVDLETLLSPARDSLHYVSHCGDGFPASSRSECLNSCPGAGFYNAIRGCCYCECGC